MHTSCNAQVLLDMEFVWIFATVREKWRCSLEVSRFSCGPAFLYATVLAACDVSTPDIPMDFPMLVASMAADSGAFSPAAFQGRVRIQECLADNSSPLPCGWTMGDHGDRVEQDYINNSTSKQKIQ